MSLLKSNSVQIGQSTTGTNNFTLSVPSSPDGTIKLARGNSGATTADILSINASGVITGSTFSGATINSSTINGGSITSGTAVASTSGTAIDFTSIPIWAKEVTISFSGVSTGGSSAFLFQLGTSGGVENSGYNACGSNFVAATTSTSGFPSHNNSPSAQHGGFIKFVNVTGNTWAGNGNFGSVVAAQVISIGGNKTLSGLLDRVRITTANGTDTYNAGSVNIMYEG